MYTSFLTMLSGFQIFTEVQGLLGSRGKSIACNVQHTEESPLVLKHTLAFDAVWEELVGGKFLC